MSFSAKSFQKILKGILTLAALYFLFLGCVFIYRSFFITESDNDTTTDAFLNYTDFMSIAHYHFNYDIDLSQDEFVKYHFNCSNTSRVDDLLKQGVQVFSYCRTQDVPTSKTNSGFSWKSEYVSLDSLQRGTIKNLFFLGKDNTSRDGYSCALDTSYHDVIPIRGTLVNCTIFNSETNANYDMSLFTFYPTASSTMSQVIDVESRIPNSKDIVQATMKDFISKLRQ